MGVILGLLHAVLAIRFKVNQIVSGTGIIILALGLTSYLQRAVLNLYPELNQLELSRGVPRISDLWLL